ncbi:unnamed protein product [Oncorhynchus mykiss]|uniref:PEHE domain-containing protein n=1 Tax=Oncorhynchus mykiss TaxID=8022 RepID=A0A060Z5Q9_ONCMY|nr:unnamed protein product [Oncorhynchus mykiss]
MSFDLCVISSPHTLLCSSLLPYSWRVVDNPPLEERERQEEEELLCDETFSQRHLGCEKREKLRWTSWDESRCYRRTTRSGSRNDGPGVSVWDSVRDDIKGDISTHVDWSCSLDTDTDRALEEWVVRKDIHCLALTSLTSGSWFSSSLHSEYDVLVLHLLTLLQGVHFENVALEISPATY